jgi:N-acetylmuramoyl-L-alanine amidase
MARQLVPNATAVTESFLPPPGAVRDRTLDILARTLWGTAGGASLVVLEAVAGLILNRVRLGRMNAALGWGSTIAEVCLAPWQFHCWDPAGPTFATLQTMSAQDADFFACTRVARRALTGALAGQTPISTHVLAPDQPDGWLSAFAPTHIAQGYRFYDLSVDQAMTATPWRPSS